MKKNLVHIYSNIEAEGWIWDLVEIWYCHAIWY